MRPVFVLALAHTVLVTVFAMPVRVDGTLPPQRSQYTTRLDTYERSGVVQPITVTDPDTFESAIKDDVSGWVAAATPTDRTNRKHTAALWLLEQAWAGRGKTSRGSECSRQSLERSVPEGIQVPPRQDPFDSTWLGSL